MKRRQLSIIGMAGIISVIVGSFFETAVQASGQVNQEIIQQQVVTGGQGELAGTSVAVNNSDAAVAQAADFPVYVALGDSVAAGAGLTVSSTATPRDTTCGRSAEAYPSIIAARLQTTVVHLACTGAKVDEGIYGPQTRSGERIPPQLDEAFASGVPDIMTTTIGANDARWTQFIRQCYITRCGTRFDDVRLKVYRADLRIELTRMLAQVRLESGGTPPQVFLSGYYDPFETLGCISGDRITETEVAWLKTQTANLNQAIRSVIPLFSFAHYVPVDFTGHELCSSDPWVQSIDAAAPVHPTATGQAMIAESFLTAMGR
jgi:lysophospholipase L1-like esterase